MFLVLRTSVSTELVWHALMSFIVCHPLCHTYFSLHDSIFYNPPTPHTHTIFSIRYCPNVLSFSCFL